MYILYTKEPKSLFQFFFFNFNIKNVKVKDLEKQDISKKALNGELKNVTAAK